jgi:hypothetical protein
MTMVVSEVHDVKSCCHSGNKFRSYTITKKKKTGHNNLTADELQQAAVSVSRMLYVKNSRSYVAAPLPDRKLGSDFGYFSRPAFSVAISESTDDMSTQFVKFYVQLYTGLILRRS